MSRMAQTGDPTRVVVTWPNYSLDSGTPGSLLLDQGLEVVLEPKVGGRSKEEVAAIMAGASAAIVSTDPFPRSVLESLPSLRVIARVGVGLDSIDVAAATELGILVTVTPNANYRVVADHTLALTLALIRRLAENDAAVRDGRWDRAGGLTPRDLGGMTVGILGFGTIGQAVAERLAPFGFDILVHDPQGVPPGSAFPQVDLDTLAARSDVLSIHVPLTPQTRGLVSEAFLARMPAGAFIINTSRGGVVDEDALVVALRSGRLAGAAIDVFASEPPLGSPLLELPQVILSPHIGGLSDASIAQMTRQATSSVLECLAGRLPTGVVNPEAASRWLTGRSAAGVGGE
jgi:phosphoglycerate dehydrogenase-like enzyme